MDVRELRYQVIKRNDCRYFFDDETLKFFGERLSDMRVFKKTQLVTDNLDEEHECWVLSSLQRKYPGGPRRTYNYFDKDTFARVIPKDDNES